METEEDRVDGRELRPPQEPGSDERLSDEARAQIEESKPPEEEES